MYAQRFWYWLNAKYQMLFLISNLPAEVPLDFPIHAVDR